MVYIETTIPSFFFEERREPEVVARRRWTRRWWENSENRYWRVSSTAVLEELNESPKPARRIQRLSLLEDLPLLPIEGAVFEIVEAYENGI